VPYGRSKAYGEQAVLEKYLDLTEKQTELNKKIKEAEAELDKKTLARYKTLYRNRNKTIGGGR
jgi:lipid II:glycine glycyltransferase (peptidoglycan interpeptide bridge formation enzyme)